MALVGSMVHEPHLAAAAAIAAHDGVQWITTWVLVEGGSKSAPTVATLLKALHRLKSSPAVPGTSLLGVVRTQRHSGETASPQVLDPGPSGHVPQLVLGRPPEHDERDAAELPDLDPAPLDPLPSSVRVVCILDPPIPADAHLRCLHVGSFGKNRA